MSVSATRDLTPGFERDIVVRRPTSGRPRCSSAARWESSSKSTNLLTPWPSLHREWLMLRLRSDWKIGENDVIRPVR